MGLASDLQMLRSEVDDLRARCESGDHRSLEESSAQLPKVLTSTAASASDGGVRTQEEVRAIQGEMRSLQTFRAQMQEVADNVMALHSTHDGVGDICSEARANRNDIELGRMAVQHEEQMTAIASMTAAARLRCDVAAENLARTEFKCENAELEMSKLRTGFDVRETADSDKHADLGAATGTTHEIDEKYLEELQACRGKTYPRASREASELLSIKAEIQRSEDATSEVQMLLDAAHGRLHQEVSRRQRLERAADRLGTEYRFLQDRLLAAKAEHANVRLELECEEAAHASHSYAFACELPTERTKEPPAAPESQAALPKVDELRKLHSEATAKADALRRNVCLVQSEIKEVQERRARLEARPSSSCNSVDIDGLVRHRDELSQQLSHAQARYNESEVKLYCLGAKVPRSTGMNELCALRERQLEELDSFQSLEIATCAEAFGKMNQCHAAAGQLEAKMEANTSATCPSESSSANLRTLPAHARMDIRDVQRSDIAKVNRVLFEAHQLLAERNKCLESVLLGRSEAQRRLTEALSELSLLGEERKRGREEFAQRAPQDGVCFV